MVNKLGNANLSRHDLIAISNWIKPNSKVMDLGCGSGTLLKHLQQTKQATGYGVELDPDKVTECIGNGVNVIQINLDQGLGHFESSSFDYVVLSLTLQAMRNPKELLQEMLRVGKQGIVTFPNFAYWRNRLQIGVSGNMPISQELPHKWYDTPNIHLCTINDFRRLCEELGFNIESSIAVNRNGRNGLGLKLAPNLFGEIALFRFSKAR